MTFSRDFARGGERLRVQLKPARDNRYVVHVGEASYEVVARRLPDGRVRFQMQDGAVHEVAGAGFGKDSHVRIDGQTYLLRRFQRRAEGGPVAANGVIEAPMTGTVLKLPVAEGTEVSCGETVAILTAMKMEHRLTAGIDGRVVEVSVQEGDTVEQGGVLLRIEAE